MTKKHYLQEWAVTLANSCLILAVPSLYMTRLKTKNKKQNTHKNCLIKVTSTETNTSHIKSLTF